MKLGARKSSQIIFLPNNSVYYVLISVIHSSRWLLTKGHVRQALETILNNNLVFQFSECLESAQPHDRMLNMSKVIQKIVHRFINLWLKLVLCNFLGDSFVHGGSDEISHWTEFINLRSVKNLHSKSRWRRCHLLEQWGQQLF